MLNFLPFPKFPHLFYFSLIQYLYYTWFPAEFHLKKFHYNISDSCHSITAEQLDGLCEFLCSGKKAASDLILRLEADRIHTLIPGLLILQHVFHLFQAQQMIVSKYGVREGYLCERVLKD